MKITADIANGNLTIEGQASYRITNRVRSYKKGTRKSHEVIKTIPDDYPYDPQPFPIGLWKITGIEWQDKEKFDPATYGPVKIRTDAWQFVKIWKLDKDGDYLEETETEVKDHGYLLHYCTSTTTLGCIRLNSASDAKVIARIIEKAMAEGQAVELAVV